MRVLGTEPEGRRWVLMNIQPRLREFQDAKSRKSQEIWDKLVTLTLSSTIIVHIARSLLLPAVGSELSLPAAQFCPVPSRSHCIIFLKGTEVPYQSDIRGKPQILESKILHENGRSDQVLLMLHSNAIQYTI